MKLLPNIRFQEELFAFFFHGPQVLVITVASLLCACGTVAVVEDESLNEGQFRLRYYYGVISNKSSVITKMEEKASELCPQGWHITGTSRKTRFVRDPVIVWDIRCDYTGSYEFMKWSN